jgi:hypothetical protein
MNDETEALSKTLLWTTGMVLQSNPEDRQRIALAYQEAQELVVSIPKDNGDASPCAFWPASSGRTPTEQPTTLLASAGHSWLFRSG